MDDVKTISVSKGCFVIPGQGKALNIDANNYLKTEGTGETKRWEISQLLWREIQFSIKMLNRKLKENIFGDLVNYINTSSNYIGNETDGRRTEIPTAALITGVNMPDHAALFQELNEKVKENVTPHVAILQAKHCLNMKSLMRMLGDQLLLKRSDCTGEDETEKSSGDEFSFMRKKSISLTMSMIKKWYLKTESSKQLQRSPPKKQKLSEQGQSMKLPIVIMCQDLEGFPQKILRDFILICSFHAKSLPIVFVFGVATSWTDVSQRLLPHSAIIHLSVKKFNAPSASSHLALLIDEILLTSDHPFKLNGRCMQLVLDVFLCHDFSIKNFLHILKFCVINHFYEKASSILCIANCEDAISLVSKLKKRDLLVFRQLPSVQGLIRSTEVQISAYDVVSSMRISFCSLLFYLPCPYALMRFNTHLTSILLQNFLTRYISELKEDEQQKLNSELNFKNAIIKLLLNVHSYHKAYFPVLRSLHSLTASLPRSPLGKQIREVFIACSRNQLAAHKGYQEAFTFLKVSSRDQIIGRLKSCVSHLENVDVKDGDEYSVPNAYTKILSFIKDFEEMGESDSQATSSDEGSDDEVAESFQNVKYAYQLQERLRSRVTQKRIRKMTKYEKLRENSLTFLKSFYECHLRRVQSLPLHEAFYFDSPSDIKKHLVPSPRLSIQTALSDPFYYLKVPSLEAVTSGVIPSNAPDLCVAYKLHNESGNLINLYDWLTAFHTIVSSSLQGDDKENSEKESKDIEIDDVTQARFIKAVSELQLLGFIKPTRKKTDHVQRLTWSHA